MNDTAENTNATDNVPEENETVTLRKRGLDNADRLALHIIGQLALKTWWVFDASSGERELITVLQADIAAAIRSGLPHMDSVAIENMMNAPAT